ncbi:hypothetical protein E2C01_072900 [Portunus trituberculatus]|uniref:Uncharacterized protein n=1 Tax=Portunus trituberculatus TaxID=210409 RepID=A0A5B7ICL5_PORTR|nr:hypothetical protein [Portunus trituberculatus]
MPKYQGMKRMEVLEKKKNQIPQESKKEKTDFRGAASGEAYLGTSEELRRMANPYREQSNSGRAKKQAWQEEEQKEEETMIREREADRRGASGEQKNKRRKAGRGINGVWSVRGGKRKGEATLLRW